MVSINQSLKVSGRKSGKKQGGQKGHPGSHMSIPHEPDEYSKHLPKKVPFLPAAERVRHERQSIYLR